MLSIKLQTIGRKHQRSYRLVIAPKRSKLASPPVEDIGFYNPVEKNFSCQNDRVLYWLKQGAQPTNSVHNLLVKYKVVGGPKKSIKIKQIKKVSDPPKNNSAVQTDDKIKSSEKNTENKS